MKLYFVRHDESETNLLGEFSNNGIKHLLTAQSLTQSQELARLAKSLAFYSRFKLAGRYIEQANTRASLFQTPTALLSG